MGDFYTLDDNHNAIPCDMHTWGADMRDGEKRRVAETVIGEVRVSTVFLGLDHSFGDGPPMLFETMVFGGPLDQDQTRCTTWEQAEEMHKQMVDRATYAGG